MSIIGDIIESTKAIIKGMTTTFSYIPKEKWTVEYPDEPVTVQPRFRGQHLLHVDELGREKCVACYLCAAACPSDCIYIVAADDPRPPEERVGVDERYAKVYNIDYGRCIFCGYCVEDRKSTRLNSSHANISYAVFCLKKKNKQPLIIISDTALLPIHCYFLFFSSNIVLFHPILLSVYHDTVFPFIVTFLKPQHAPLEH